MSINLTVWNIETRTKLHEFLFSVKSTERKMNAITPNFILFAAYSYLHLHQEGLFVMPMWQRTA